jgi:hypothetical protein
MWGQRWCASFQSCFICNRFYWIDNVGTIHISLAAATAGLFLFCYMLRMLLLGVFVFGAAVQLCAQRSRPRSNATVADTSQCADAVSAREQIHCWKLRFESSEIKLQLRFKEVSEPDTAVQSFAKRRLDEAERQAAEYEGSPMELVVFFQVMDSLTRRKIRLLNR